MSEYRFNSVAILDAIPSGNLNTARALRDDLEAIASFSGNGLRVRYFRVETLACLRKALETIRGLRRTDDIEPLLHIEAHGLVDEGGFALPNAQCGWIDLKELITPLNTDMGLKLLLVMAACHGGSFAKAIATTDRAPVAGLIGPKERIGTGDLQRDFIAFYKTLFGTLSFDKAIKQLNPAGQKRRYFYTSAEDFFYAVWRGYKRAGCTVEALDKRARDIYRTVKANGMHRSVGSIKRQIKSQELSSFDRYRDTYFMYDLYPENERRFVVTYEKAEAVAALI